MLVFPALQGLLDGFPHSREWRKLPPKPDSSVNPDFSSYACREAAQNKAPTPFVIKLWGYLLKDVKIPKLPLDF